MTQLSDHEDSDLELDDLNKQAHQYRRSSSSSSTSSHDSFDIHEADPTTSTTTRNHTRNTSTLSSSSRRHHRRTNNPQNDESSPSIVAKSTLSRREKRNIAVLFAVYFVHALPMTFSWATMPLLLRQQLNYTLMATYFISQYPYSIKILWSPLVQAKYVNFLGGRRKSWIVPCFFGGGLVLLWLAYHQDELIVRTAGGEGYRSLIWLMAAWFILTFLCSCIRIALDDWSLDLFTQGNVHWASPTVTLAEMSAAFFSFNLFLLGSSIGNPDAGGDGEEVSTMGYFAGMGVAFIIMSGLVVLIGRATGKAGRGRSGSGSMIGASDDQEKITGADNDNDTENNKNRTSNTKSKPKAKPSARKSYAIILRIIKLRHVWILMCIHLTSMIGFMANDAIAVLQLSKSALFTDRDIAAMATISLPLELVAGVLISKKFRTYHPLYIWRKIFPYRLGISLVTQVSVLLATKYREQHVLRWLIALGPYLVSRQFEDMMFIALVSFHAQVADPQYGGIYLPLLATTLNIRYDVMGFVITKVIGWIDGGEGMGVQTSADVHAGKKVKLFDGYQIVNICAVAVAVPVFWFFLRPATMRLQRTERKEWRVGDGGDDGEGVDKGEYSHVRVEDEEEGEAGMGEGVDEAERRLIEEEGGGGGGHVRDRVS